MTPQRSENFLERPLPSSEEAERCILGGILLDNKLAAEAKEVLQPRDFYSPINARVYRAMISLFEESRPIDPILVIEEMKKEGPVEAIGGISTVANLTYGLPHFTDLSEYVGKVKEKSIARQMVRRCNDLTTSLLAEKMSVGEICSRTRESLALFLETAEGNYTGLKPFPLIRMSEVEEEEVEWLWKPFISIGTYTLVDGEEEAGKTMLFCNIAGAIGRGRGLPGTAAEDHIGPSNTLFVSAEDSVASELKKRLRKAGAPDERVFVLEEPFTLDREGIERLSLSIAACEAKLVVIDPLFSYTGRINLNNDNEIRYITGALKRLAEKHNCAIVGIRHIGKAKGYGDPRNAGLNGIGWRTSARSVLLVGKHPEHQHRRALCQIKNNIE